MILTKPTNGSSHQIFLSQQNALDKHAKRAGGIPDVHRCAKIIVHIVENQFCTEEVPIRVSSDTSSERIRYMDPIFRIFYRKFSSVTPRFEVLKNNTQHKPYPYAVHGYYTSSSRFFIVVLGMSKTLKTFQMGKHANLEGSNLNDQQKENVKELFMRHHQVFSRNSNDLGYCDKNKDQTKLNKDAQPFRRSYCSMSFDKRKAMKKIVEDLEDAKLIEPTHSYWAAPLILVKKRWQLHTGCRGLYKQTEKTSRPLPRIIDIVDFLDGNSYFSNIDLT